MARVATHEETNDQLFKRQNKEREDRIAACPVKETDLLPISRGTDKCISYVTLDWGNYDDRITWLKFGEASLRTNDRRDGRWNLEARMGLGATDPEHDTAFALRLPLIGVEFEWADHHQFRFHGFVDPSAGEGRHPTFHVPLPGYNPTKHPEAETCNGVYDEKKGQYCKWNDKKKHIIVPEGFYVPPFDAELYKLVAGKKVEIVMGKKHGKEDED